MALPDLAQGKVLKPLREFILPSAAQLRHYNQSSVFYMDMLNECADSQETMALVAEMLQEQLLETQQWVVLVGDGKTFEHLQKVKRTYASACGNLFIFPGGWHILKNFQPVLFKAYYHTGLKEIAEASGYKGGTLKSLENCSHFQRTHSFIVQVCEAIFTEMVVAFIKARPQQKDLVKSVRSALKQAIDGNTTTNHNFLLTVGLGGRCSCI